MSAYVHVDDLQGVTDGLYVEKEDLYNYTCSSGLVLPLISEFTWGKGARGFVYFFGLIYCFLGVAIIADIFMGAIERITSRTRKVYLADAKEDEPEVIEVRIWNDTVANLTLMALGSSAPEILLSCIEIIGNDFNAGQLGPGTIVGSAAFNLLCITGVCIMAIPTPEVRTINGGKVFMLTSSCSVFAYLWLIVILVGNSPNEVEVWEAAVTFMCFPLLVVLAYVLDKGFCGLPRGLRSEKQIELGNFSKAPGKPYFKNGQLDKEGLIAFVKELKRYPGLSDEDKALLAASKLVENQEHSRMWYRIGAVRDFTGGRKTRPNMTVKLQEVYNVINEHPEAPDLGEVPQSTHSHDNAIIEFHAASCAVMENIGTFSITIIRYGKLDNSVQVRVETMDGSAVAKEDYVHIDQVIEFQPKETEKQVSIEIINDNQWEPDEEFFVKLSLLPEDEDNDTIQLGRIKIMEITILNDDEPGILCFNKRGFLVKESCEKAYIPVIRKNGADGEVSVHYKTKDKSAIAGRDYKEIEGTLNFKNSETEMFIEVEIIDDMAPEKDEHFEIELSEPTGGAKLGNINRTIVTITNDDDFNSLLSKMMLLTNANVDCLKVTHETWTGQIRDAMNVNGGDIENATHRDYFMHFLTFGWKILFALVPPAGVLGGVPCFIIALVMIGFLTAIIGDLASIFGCLIGLKDTVTAITFVALGTSLPDLFASKVAATKEQYADNAVGNVTGSNSVNVFLGLGLPWLIAAIYHKSNKSKFEVPSGNLVFSVSVFTACAIVALAVLAVRRFVGFFGKGELGGPKIPKYLSGMFLFFLWLMYVLLSSLQTYGHIAL